MSLLIYCVELIIVSNILVKVGARDCKLPDGIDKHLFTTNCDTGETVQLLSAQILKPDGTDNYPISLSYPIRIVSNATNSGPVVPHIYVDVDVWTWSNSFFYCGWVKLPTFGLLNSIDGCMIGGCPLTHGVYGINTVYDITQFSAIIGHLTNGVSLKIHAHIKDGNTSSAKQIGCFVFETTVQK